MEDSLNETDGAPLDIEDQNLVRLEFVRTGISIHLVRFSSTQLFLSGKSKQDPNGPFPGTLYSHELFKVIYDYDDGDDDDDDDVDDVDNVSVLSQPHLKEEDAELVHLLQVSHYWMFSRGICGGLGRGGRRRYPGLASQICEGVIIRGKDIIH